MVESVISRKWVCCAAFVLFLHIRLATSSNDAPCVTLDGVFTCYSKNPDPYRLYASKTKYHVVNEDYTKIMNITGCAPKALYLFSRHAVRYPKQKYMTYFNNGLPDLRNQIMNASKKGKVNMCQEDIDLLDNWKPTFDPDNVAQIALAGAHEAKELGERLRQRFPSLLGLPYSPDVFTIQYTFKNRTRQTAEDFARGVFSPEEYSKIDFNEDKQNNDILWFYKRCGSILSKCKKPNFDKSEYEKFKHCPLQEDVYRSLSNRTGIKISRHQQKRMYRACALGFAMMKSDAWCTVFSRDELRVMEFRADLKQYYVDGYGNPQINVYAPCPVIKYIVDLFKNVVNSGQVKVTLHFSHSGAIKKLFTTFGLYRDNKPLMADHMCEQEDRKWRSSYICPFTTNIVLVLYECDDDEYKVVTLHNENPVIIDGCDDYVCPLSQFLDYYEPIGNNCDLEKICYNCKKE